MRRHITLTRAQRKAVANLYRRNADGSQSYRAFRARVQSFFGAFGAVCIPQWCGMFVGIEPDGYTHT